MNPICVLSLSSFVTGMLMASSPRRVAVASSLAAIDTSYALHVTCHPHSVGVDSESAG
jgi:hypothetical protein